MGWRGVVGWMLGLGACAPEVTAGGGGETGSEASSSSTDPETFADASGSSSDGGDETIDPFADAQLVVLEDLAGELAFADYDGDGDDDIVASWHVDNPFTGGVDRLSVYAFDAATATATELRHTDVSARWTIHPGHVDGDPTMDIVGTGRGGGNSLTQIGTVDGGFVVAPTHEADGVVLPPVLDIDGDGRVEYLEVDGELRIHGADGMGGWLHETTMAPSHGCPPSHADWTDLDRDGDLDLVASGGCGGEVAHATSYLQADDGTFASAAVLDPLLQPAAVELADVDLDGVPDLFMSSFSDALGEPFEIVVFRGEGDGSFGAELLRRSFDGLGGLGARAADFDGDGIDELYTSVYVFPELAEPGSSGARLRFVDGELDLLAVPFALVPSAAADLNGDGCDDLVDGPSGERLSVLLSAC